MCDRLLGEGHTVAGIDNFLTGSARNLAHLTSHTQFRFLRHDVTLPLPADARVDMLDGRIDAVIHMASPARPQDYLEHPIETLDVSSEGTRKMLELARLNGARLLRTSTSDSYD